ncbi:gas vesicle protein [Candidatus Bipolaricaulota bacterium]|nr:gas vesicle protein [Candidatus Bipolaricaulota bacterium]
MEPERDEVVDLLDRILEKGVVLNTDLIITLADVPLIGIDLRLALAGIDRMLDYGLFEDWEAAHKAGKKASRNELTDPEL